MSIAEEEDECCSTITASDYKKLLPEEHVRVRPDMYFGNKNPLPITGYTGAPVLAALLQKPWSICDALQQKTSVVIYPGILTLLSELVVNAFDSARSDPLSIKMNKRIVKARRDFAAAATKNGEDYEWPKNIPQAVVELYFSEEGVLQVTNYGEGMPTCSPDPSDSQEKDGDEEGEQQDKSEPIPQMCFGSFYSGSNFDDDDTSSTRFGGGRNGFGAAIVNIMSLSFSVDVKHAPSRTQYQQTWSGKVLGDRSEPLVQKVSRLPYGQVSVSCVLDTGYFYGTEESPPLNKTHLGLLLFRVMCASYSSGILARFGGLDVPCDLPSLCAPTGIQMFRDEIKVAKKVRFMVSWWVSLDGPPPPKIGIVNGVYSPLGSHVNHAVSVIWEFIKEQSAKPAGNGISNNAGQSAVMRRVGLVVSVLVERPQFSSNSKEKLVTPRRDIGFGTWTMGRRPAKAFASSEAMANLTELCTAARRLSSVGSMSAKKRRKVMLKIADKLVDAKNAGKKHNTAFLVLTEGDSAASLVHAGRSSLPDRVGEKNCGSMVLRGKMLNVRNVKIERMMANKEVSGIVSALGIVPMKVYETLEELNHDLRYHAGVVILSDQDTDGSHIAGLVCNTLEVMFPSVFRLLPHFVRRFVTPVVICQRRGRASEKFYSLQDYEAWRNVCPDTAQYTIDYYKGLATSSDAQAREYFSNFYAHILNLHFTGDRGSEEEGWVRSAKSALEFAFSSDKTMQDSRKSWLLGGYDATASIRYEKGNPTNIDVQDFIRTDVAHFWNDDNLRSIPHVLDGLKESQRKAVFVLIVEYLKKSAKLITIERMANRIAEVSGYHHGSKSMEETITRMAQDWVGSPFQNLPLLQRAAQFGTRWNPAKVHGASRYLRSLPHALLPLVFPPADLPLLERELADGVECEPRWFVPVIPFVLVNGMDGIGTGFSTHIPPHDPMALVDLLLGRLETSVSSEATAALVGDNAGLQPYVHGFVGDVRLDDKIPGNYLFTGQAEAVGNTVSIRELPMVPIQSFLNSLVKRHEKARPKSFLGGLQQIHNYSTVHNVNIDLEMSEDVATNLDPIDTLGLVNRKIGSYSNMYLWGADGKLLKVEALEDVLREHSRHRLDLYARRKARLLEDARHRLAVLRMKCQFTEHVISGRLTFHPCKTQDELELYLDANSFEKLVDGKYDYLLSIAMTSLTRKVVDRNENKIVELEREVQVIETTTPEDMWKDELHQLRKGLLSYRAIRAEDRRKSANESRARKSSSKSKKKRKREPEKKKKKKKKKKLIIKKKTQTLTDNKNATKLK